MNPNDNPSQHASLISVTFMEGCYTSSYDVSHRDKYSVSLLLFPCALQLSQDVLMAAGVPCNRAAVLWETVRGRACIIELMWVQYCLIFVTNI